VAQRFAPIDDPRPDDVAWRAMSWPPPPDVELAGDIVTVRPLVVARDAGALFAAIDDDRVWRHLPWHPADAAAYGTILSGHMASGVLPWLVRVQAPRTGVEGGSVVGVSCYLDVSVRDARLEIGGTAYRPDVWGTAVNPECKLLLLRYAFETLGVGRVQLKTDVRNVRSQQAIARLGARYEGTLGRYQRRADGTVRDTVLFSVLAEDWPAVEAGLRARLGSP
jgi:RimJ/RimL family protein N-acetyltransferase